MYQATEGLLGVTCEAGTLHLNEPFVLVEREWQDDARTRFVPVVTDLWRRAQPVIRYRLDDVLCVAPTPCPCGRAATAIAAIEGRRDDVLWLHRSGADVPVFPDLVTRAVVRAVRVLEDYEIVATRSSPMARGGAAGAGCSGGRCPSRDDRRARPRASGPRRRN